MRSIRNIWFDLDGTLIDVRTRFVNTHLKICNILGIKPCLPDEYWLWRCEGKSTREILRIISAEQYLDDYYVQRNVLLESTEMLDLDILREGAKELLKGLSNDADIFLLTGRIRTDTLLVQLEKLKIKPYFSAIHIVSAFGDWRDKHSIIAQKGGQKTDWIVGDTARDILAGNAAGINSVAITGGMSTRKRLEKSNPIVIIDELTELNDLLISRS